MITRTTPAITPPLVGDPPASPRATLAAVVCAFSTGPRVCVTGAGAGFGFGVTVTVGYGVAVEDGAVFQMRIAPPTCVVGGATGS